jgi:2-oxoglutarate ferredoxin oxidoreductase subunit alpha
MEAAVNRLRAEGEQVSALTVYSLWPLPEKKILEVLKGIKRIIIPEMNHGQYRQEIERLTNGTIDLVGVNRVDTFLITPEEIMESYHG